MTTDATARSKPLRCSQCNYRSAYISDMSRHLAMTHSKVLRPATVSAPASAPNASARAAATAATAASQSMKRTAKPLPNLIPIQSKAPSKSASGPEKVMTERDMNDICAKSCPTSSLRDFASVIGDESAFRTSESNEETESSVDQGAYFGDDAAATDGETSAFGGINSDKKRNGSFFDQLTEKLMPSTSIASPDDPSSLVCVWCGHEAKCLSELVRHQKLHNGQTRGTTSSTRCQHCRHRCKSSTDLVLHLKSCSKAVEAQPGGSEGSGGGAKDEDRDAHPMENKVFVWNNVTENVGSLEEDSEQEQQPDGPVDEPMETEDYPDVPDDEEADGDAGHDGEAQDGDGDSGDGVEITIPTADASLLCVETAPGYGSVTTQTDFDANAQAKILQTVTSVKKVFKCPHCSFWASTASRFHVHIVGHLNKKPFECSLCSYRSNWRWDITKHIRLKAARDSAHEDAKVLMTDETGRRNYSKYNKHLAFMKVAEPNAENLLPPGGRQTKAVANGLQGNIVTTPLEPVPILPAPPKLTRAPTPRSSVQVPQLVPGTMLRPPPPLQAATHLIILNTLPPSVRVQQPQASQLQNQQQPSQQQQKSPQETQHKQQQKPKSVPQQSQQNQALKRPADEPLSSSDSDAKRVNTDIKKTVWRCKQCHFRDGDRQVVLAHVKGHYRQNQEAAMRLAKLKSAGIVISPNKNELPKLQPKRQTQEAPSPAKKVEGVNCKICPYVASSEAALQVHVSHHQMKPDAIFKCYLCPYYVNKKADLVVHMSVHGVTNKDDFIERTMVIKTANTNGSDSSSKVGDIGTPGDIFNGTDPSSSQECSGMDVDGERYSQSPAPDLDMSNLTETPVCWVLRNGNFVKMFKCRSCPHVNMRKSNISEHERMHGKRFFVTSDGAEISHNTSYQCSDCSYVCNNAGVLSSHSKVHNPDYPKAYGFVDPYRSDDSQIREISEKYRISLESTKDLQDGITVKEGKLNGINIMSLLNPNQSITDAVLGMKKKFNLELDGEPFAEPQEDPSESPPSSPLKQLNEELDPSLAGRSDEKKLHFCQQCPARFLYRKELGIHARFHNLHLIHRCESCSYTARQRTHLQAHYKVHTDEYQERTKALLKMYKVNTDFPVPRTAALAEVQGMQGPVWIVVNALTVKKSNEIDIGLPHIQPAPPPDYSATSPVPEQTSVPSLIEDENGKMKYCCSKCPATFFKPVALEYHSTLHGGSGPHKCRHCDYAVKTYGNLVKHMSMHGKKDSYPKVPSARTCHAKSVPLSGTDLFQQRNELNDALKLENRTIQGFPEQVEKSNLDKEEGKENKKDESDHNKDKYGIFIKGSPDFVYPTYFKNGRLKEKRYKCHKCPSAFEKRDQYTVHLTLHGSNQRYSCNKCDYSVKYYANYIQHIRKHKNSDAAKASNNDDDSKMSDKSEGMDDDKAEEFLSENESPALSRSLPQRSMKTIGRGERLSVADKQALMVMQQRQAKHALVSQGTIDKNYWCLHCPYSNPRRDQVEVHMKKHICVSGVQNTFTCEHCDYSGPSKHYLREHTKLHFDVSKTPRPNAYMVCEGLELYANTDSRKNKTSGKILIFQDKGCSSLSDRFLPPLLDEVKEETVACDNRQYINLSTLEPDSKEAADAPEGRNSQSDSDCESEAHVVTNPSSGVLGENNGGGKPSSDTEASDIPAISKKSKSDSPGSSSPVAVNGIPSLDDLEGRPSDISIKEEPRKESN